MKRGLRISIIVIVAFAFLVYAWIHRDTRTFTGSIAIDFNWSEPQGFQEIAVEWPHWGPLYSKLIAHQAEPFIAREIKDAGWRSAKGRLNVGTFLMLFVLGIDRLSDNNAKIVDPEVTPLMRAVEDGNGDLAATLISEGAPVNTQDQRGWTALMHASMNGHSREAAILLASGADSNLKDKDGKTAFFWAAENCRSDVALLLLRAGAERNVRDRNGYSVMDYTTCPAIIKDILQRNIPNE